jgi:hypothetical protein
VNPAEAAEKGDEPCPLLGVLDGIGRRTPAFWRGVASVSRSRVQFARKHFFIQIGVTQRFAAASGSSHTS